MANPFQQRSLARKLIYFGLIVGLFTVSLMHRRFQIEPEATALQLREAARGEVDPTSAVLQRVLLGSRGMASTMLWYVAKEKQKKHQWNELELVVGYITKLQPHFLLPWRFLSWNLAFNVAVECDRARDKYYFISRGLELEAEGERRNQGSQEEVPGSRALVFPGSPDMRWEMGFFYQLKIAGSDEQHYMRCLFDLSCIDPLERDPARFRQVDASGRRRVNPEELKKFCRNHPRLVRRLSEHLKRETPLEIVAFLEDNKDIPSRFEAAPTDGSQVSPLRKPREQFPILPNPKVLGDLPDPTKREFTEAFDVFHAARAWYSYAQEPLPPPSPDAALMEEQLDPMRYRLPKMAIAVFRSYPSRTVFHIAELLEEEGWFDEEDGWTIKRWFRTGPGRGSDVDLPFGSESKYHAGPAWKRAYKALTDFGHKNGLLFTAKQHKDLEDQARLFRETYHVPAGGGLPGELRGDLRKGGMGASFDAHKRLHWYGYYRHLTNFDAFFQQAAVEKKEETVAVRKLFFQADRLSARADLIGALKTYEAALPRWLDVLLAHQAFRHIEEMQEETYERQLKHLSLYQKQLPAKKTRHLEDVMEATLQLGAFPCAITPVAGLPLLELEPGFKRKLLPLRKYQGPFELTYVFEVPESEAEALDLKGYLLALTQTPLAVPLALSAPQKNRLLTVRSFTAIPTPPEAKELAWWPLISEQAVGQVRNLRRLDRQPVASPVAPSGK
jgi:hypothetical protein